MVLHRPLVLLLTLAVMVLSLPAAASSEEELLEYVEQNTQRLVEKLNTERDLYQKDKQAFYRSMEEALTNFVDFRRIAARVMGRYARQTTPEQRDRFVTTFKRSLFDSYAQAMVDAEDFRIEVKEAVINPNNKDRASVSMEVISASGNRYPVTYSMYRNNEERWLMENVIIEGVNVGLAFRDRFAQEMEKNGGNVEAVINSWSGAVESLEDDKKESQS
ncbi:MAG TPA: toluene tolerance protein [Marinobacter sp.]|uniref:MlaC/ttg2D family ABC transporter substrate-binding protein n=1 Tax=Marinobacter sp. TaxID=50741 RepID=UPI000EE46264|nr:ABC transporter substrate-binding protein [Marinobacter sp.]MBC7193595.1 ABC transporter substrate-binding protein [Marinobacter sp.]HCW90894.1 toluene tolerance protein [Marinobacter sp.]